MDPDETLLEILRLTREGEEARTNEEAAQLYGEALERFAELHAWMSRAGFLPAIWQRGR